MEANQSTAPREVMSEQRVCKAHCGHRDWNFKEGICHFLLSLEPRIMCAHVCTFEPVSVPEADEVGERKLPPNYFTKMGASMFSVPDAVPQSEAQHEFVGQYGLGNKFCAFPVGLHQCLQPRSAPIHQTPPAPAALTAEDIQLGQAAEMLLDGYESYRSDFQRLCTPERILTMLKRKESKNG